ncbi:zinc-binding dehydrogenase [Nonomuraea africana]|uniref:NADPH2:quinone reductase n=1 Tax=Nonomuraea africana TaxID=46171 RepID=A0ABR9KEK6_9ACTN|nr:quinone oxidoreductase [Nonomuraea africana]MBE1560098.1 NADPH2:quinone reductase [Nonomuraea africana]
MKAIRIHEFGGPDVLRLDDVDVPEPGDGQVLLKVEVAGVAYGDVMKRRGAFGPELPLPTGLGIEVVGTIERSGPRTEGLSPGTRVAAWVEHGYAEYAVAQAEAVVALPETISSRDAAALPVHGLTAYQTLHEAGSIRRDDTVLVHAAAGGVGTLAVQLARLAGAKTVIGTASRADKLDHARALGADVVLDYTADGWVEGVLEATGGRGADLVLESTGGDVVLRSLRCMAPFGRMVTYGAAGGTPDTFPSMSLMDRNLSIIGYSLMGWMRHPKRTAQAIGQLTDHLATGALKVSVGAVLPLEAAAEAHRAIEERRTIGKTLLLPHEQPPTGRTPARP